MSLLSDPNEPASQPGGGLVRIRLDVAYDGTSLSGWAAQPGRRTVQGLLEEALGRVLRLAEPPALTVAGRTDAGVHARGQVAHVDLPPDRWDDGRTLVRRLAGVLPGEVRVLAASAAPAGFDARFSALSRRYAYRLCDDPAGPDPLRRFGTTWHRRPLAVEPMARACAALEGEHDFAAFCRRREGASTVRGLLRYAWRRDESGLLVADIEADAFCHHMVRALVGAAVAVGEGRRPVDWPAAVLAAGVRDSGVTVMPPQGLTLEEVRYPPDADLTSRARVTRNRRA
ncbi:MAG: tRNA pseudouridine(38-40) synthase TruA [Streptosporangiales bacterium]|nr:tRNA pseudouridine(38-40) synthase TruA [Streptosporangiales bacterium]